mgnify:CR=1 FL=1
MAIAPYLKHGSVPALSLDNVSLKFSESTFFERTAIHDPRGILVAGAPGAQHPSMAVVADRSALLQSLRSALKAQALPVVETLHAWAGFAPKGTWGMLTSSHDDVRTQFHHTVGRKAEIVRRIGRGFGKGDEKTVLPAWHARFRIRHQLAATQVK